MTIQIYGTPKKCLLFCFRTILWWTIGIPPFCDFAKLLTFFNLVLSFHFKLQSDVILESLILNDTKLQNWCTLGILPCYGYPKLLFL